MLVVVKRFKFTGYAMSIALAQLSWGKFAIPETKMSLGDTTCRPTTGKIYNCGANIQMTYCYPDPGIVTNSSSTAIINMKPNRSIRQQKNLHLNCEQAGKSQITTRKANPVYLYPVRFIVTNSTDEGIFSAFKLDMDTTNSDVEYSRRV